MADSNMIAGLSSPGPKYDLPSTFQRASSKSKHPIWGSAGPESLKSGRYRCEEVRFQGRRHMREMVGHFSPGPLYDVPGSVGGSTGNFIAATKEMLGRVSQFTGQPVVKRSAADLGGRPAFNTTLGSFADGGRRGNTAAGQGSTAYWRSATMVQPREHLQGPSAVGARQVWMEDKEALGQTKLQDDLKATLKERWRQVPSAPFRMVPDMVADPPFASVFGPGKCRTDYGGIGGIEKGWRESKVGTAPAWHITCLGACAALHRLAAPPACPDTHLCARLDRSQIQGYSSTAPKIGPAPVTGPLRYAFVQNMGPNSVPRGTALADFDGGRATAYKPRRPTGPNVTISSASSLPATR